MKADVEPEDAATIKSLAEGVDAKAVDGLANVSAATAAVVMSAADVAAMFIL